MYDLALSGGSLDEDKLADYVMTHDTGVDVLLAPARPDQASAITIELLRDVLAIARAHYDFVDRRHAAGLHGGGHLDDRRELRPRDGRNARLALAQEHEARARDAAADGLRRVEDPARAQPRRHARRASATTTSSPSSGASPTSSSRPTARSRARSTRASRSTLSRPQSYAAASFHELAALFTGGAAGGRAGCRGAASQRASRSLFRLRRK